MRFTTKTEYGLVCLTHMARNGWLNPVTARELSEKENFSLTYTEKILQALRHGGVVASGSGHKGGHVLTRPPAEINLLEIVIILEGGVFDVFCDPEVRKKITCTHLSLCGIKPVWHKTKQTLEQLYSSLTLEMIAENRVNEVEVEIVNSKGVLK